MNVLTSLLGRTNSGGLLYSLYTTLHKAGGLNAPMPDVPVINVIGVKWDIDVETL